MKEGDRIFSYFPKPTVDKIYRECARSIHKVVQGKGWDIASRDAWTLEVGAAPSGFYIIRNLK